MRVCVIDRGSRFPTPPEQTPALWEAFRQWRERWRDKMESFEFFADGRRELYRAALVWLNEG